MYLSYIHLGLDYYHYIQKNNSLRYTFQQHTNFINDFFSKEIRKYKFKTDGTFNMISVAATEFEIQLNSIVPVQVLKVNLPFNEEEYKTIGDDVVACDYYLGLLEKGFKKASEFKEIPLEHLLNLIEKFKAIDCRNEWIQKRKSFKNHDLEVILSCDFTTNYFQLIITINHISAKKTLVQGTILKTEAGISIHQGMYKDVIITDDIIVTDKSDSPRIIIDKKSAFLGKLSFKILGSSELKEILSYQLL